MTKYISIFQKACHLRIQFYENVSLWCKELILDFCEFLDGVKAYGWAQDSGPSWQGADGGMMLILFCHWL